MRAGTSACSVRGFYSRKSRQSRQRLREIFREIREIITLVFSSDAARRRPYPLTTHYSLLKAHCSKAVADSRLCRRRMCEGRLNITGSRTRGYSPFRASRPSDANTYLRKREKHVFLLRRICYSLFLSIRVCDPIA